MYDDPHLLSPSDAASAAVDVYDLINKNLATGSIFGSSKVSQWDSKSPNYYTDSNSGFAIPSDGRLMGTSGISLGSKFVFFRDTGFGYVARRTKNGVGGTLQDTDLDADTLVVLRGTDILTDWLTDATIASEIGPSGHKIHAGFNRTYKSISKHIHEIVSINKTSRVHVIGHSLGGALAVVAASDFIANKTFSSIYCYTFGAPRVGDTIFSDWIVKKIGRNRYIRVFDPQDPVPMVPFFPYQHSDTPSLKLSGPADGSVDFSKHRMEKNYESKLLKVRSWDALIDSTSQLTVKTELEWWLEVGLKTSSILMGSIKFFEIISKCLSYLVFKIDQTAIHQYGHLFNRYTHLVDRISAKLYFAVKSANDELKKWSMNLINATQKLIGRTPLNEIDITEAMLNFIFQIFFRIFTNFVTQATALSNLR